MNRQEFLFKHIKNGKILDIGNLGDGGTNHLAIIKKFSEADIHGIDSENQEKYRLAFNNQYQGRAEDLPFADAEFDYVYCGEILEHTWEPKKIIDECYRVLKSSGLLILDTPNIYSLSRMVKYIFTGKDNILGDPTHKIFYSRSMLENLIKKSGFEMVEILSDRKFTLKGRNYYLPNFGSFVYLGEHLLITAKK